jgi:NADH-quinone oxidoreductase subunit L
MGMFTAFLTAFYMFRLFYLTFHGASRVDSEVAHHVHESPGIMTQPLVILAGLSLVGGLIPGFPPEAGWIHHFLGPVAGEEGHHGLSSLDFLLMGGSVLVAIAGWALARGMYQSPSPVPGRLSGRFERLYRLLLNKYWVDEFYDLVVVQMSKLWGRVLWLFDREIVDGIVRGIGRMTHAGAALSTGFEKYIIYGFLNTVAYFNHLAAAFLRLMQTGLVHHYAALIVLGLFLLMNIFLLFTVQLVDSR